MYRTICFWVWFHIVIFWAVNAFGEEVGLFDIFEVSVENTNDHDNPFDFEEIELQATFTAPSGREIDFFGFYDGNGVGGQSGNVWKLRFMPDETGRWTYTYRWTDQADGGEGEFTVADTGLGGPLKVATDNSYYFMNARDDPFHLRGYGMHSFLRNTDTNRITEEIETYKDDIQTFILDRGYNFTMWNGSMEVPGWGESWWFDYDGDKEVFDIAVWKAREEALRLAKDNGLYVIYFGAMIFQGTEYDFETFKTFLKYWVARFGPFYNSMGWSPTWEWTDIWNPSQVNQIMGYMHDINPFPTMLTIHDCSHSSFSEWLSFSMRQRQSRTIFEGNSRRSGKKQGSCDGNGGIGEPFTEKPIIGSEDIWETESGKWGLPRNPTEVRRGAWGVMMGGVLPIYTDWHPYPPPEGGKGPGEMEVRRMFDFIYQRTHYRQYQQMNDLVSSPKRQIASGIANKEYLIYDEDGGQITLDLSDTSGSDSFFALWYDPTDGNMVNGGIVQGGDSVTFDSPFNGDSVLFVYRPDLNDCIFILRQLVELAPENGQSLPIFHGDVDANGKLELKDCISILHRISG